MLLDSKKQKDSMLNKFIKFSLCLTFCLVSKEILAQNYIKSIIAFGRGATGKDTVFFNPSLSKLVLDYEKNNIVIFLDTQKGKDFQYKVLGVDDKWLQCNSQDYIYLMNLEGGYYQLILKDEQTDKTQTLSIELDSPFWLRWWFLPLMFLYLLILVSIFLYFLFQYRLRQQLRTQIVRDTIARDLHDDIGSYLSSISILSQNVDNLILNNPEKARQSLTKIGETARQVMDTMGDIVWSINPTHDSMEQIVNRMKDFANELFFNQDIEINFQASDSLKKVNLTLERRRDFFLIYKESMTNIYKYAEANLVICFAPIY